MWLAFGLACAATILGFAGHWLWSFDQVSHFRSQYFTILLVCLAFFIFTRFYFSAVLATGLALVNLSLLVPLYLPGSKATIDHPNLRIVSANVDVENRERHQLNNLVETTNPDFLALFEVDHSWTMATKELAQRFKYSRVESTKGYFGIALFSQYPIERIEMRKFGSYSQYAIIAHLTVNEKPFHIIAAHVPAPIKKSYFDLRNEHLQELANTAVDLDGPVMLVGDLNITPWSPYFDDLLERSNLQDGRKGFGIQATWPVQFSLMQIPIDHCLVSPGINIQQWSRGPDIGSDHYPIIVDFAIQKTNSPATFAQLESAKTEDKILN